jgi:hypothetical protein
LTLHVTVGKSLPMLCRVDHRLSISSTA